MRWKRARKSAAAAEKATQAVWRARGGSGLRGGPGSEDEDEALAEVNFGGGPRVLKEREWREEEGGLERERRLLGERERWSGAWEE